MKGMSSTAGALLLALVAAPATAGTLYRCVGADGVTSYVNNRVAGATCAVFSRYSPDRTPRASVPVHAPAKPASARASVTTVSPTPVAGVAMVAASAPAEGAVDSPVPSMRVSSAPLPPA